MLIATVLCVFTVARGLRLSGDIADLLPDDTGSEALRTYARVFGGGDLAVVLVRGNAPRDVAKATQEATIALRQLQEVKAAVSSLTATEHGKDPTLAWAWADPEARRRLAHLLTDDGMRERLRETKLMLLAPGSAGIVKTLTRDPLKLAQVPFEGGVRL